MNTRAIGILGILGGKLSSMEQLGQAGWELGLGNANRVSR